MVFPTESRALKFHIAAQQLIREHQELAAPSNFHPRAKFWYPVHSDGTVYHGRIQATSERAVINLSSSFSLLHKPEHLDLADVFEVPAGAACRGVSQEQWTQEMIKLRRALRKDTLPLAGYVLAVAAAPFTLWKLAKRQARFAQFMEEWNKEFLEPLGMHAKVQSSAAAHSSRGVR